MPKINKFWQFNTAKSVLNAIFDTVNVPQPCHIVNPHGYILHVWIFNFWVFKSCVLIWKKFSSYRCENTCWKDFSFVTSQPMPYPSNKLTAVDISKSPKNNGKRQVRIICMMKYSSLFVIFFFDWFLNATKFDWIIDSTINCIFVPATKGQFNQYWVILKNMIRVKRRT